VNGPTELREAPHLAAGLRDAAAACSAEQGVLQARLVAAAATLDRLAKLASDALTRVLELKDELDRAVAARVALEEHVAAINSIPVEWLRPAGPPPEATDSPVIVCGVDVSNVGAACRMLDTVEQVMDADDDPDAADDSDAAELIAVISTARKLLQTIFAELQGVARKGGAS
jgi:hypothetical protein